MSKLLLLILTIALFACNESEIQGVNKELWSFDASKNNPQLDNLCTPLVKDYEGLLQRLVNKDTADLFNKSKSLILKLDSLPHYFITKDTALLHLFTNNALNLKNELQGVLLEQYPEDLNLAMNMVSVQLLHLLGSIGYKKQGVYIFNSNGTKASLEEDGLIWISLNKKSINPYYNIDNELINANYILQENQ